MYTFQHADAKGIEAAVFPESILGNNVTGKGATMMESLPPGLKFTFQYTVPEDKTVPCLMPEAEEMQVMPKVLATGFMVGVVEWSCIRAVNPHLDWPREQTVGTGVYLTHTAPTPPGLTMTVHGTLESVEGRKLTFSIEADDGVDHICSGSHERFVINAESFTRKTEEKRRRALS
jgi:fluoroacetyl-CoA thioesterase